MKQLIAVLLFVIYGLTAHAQTETAEQLVKEGVALHDKGDYENALKKYDAAIAADAGFFDAYYEKTYTLYTLNKPDQCIELCKKIIDQFPSEPKLKAIYVQYGSSLDNKNDHEGAINLYNEGLKKFPGYFLLLFNRGITYNIMGDEANALSSYEAALVSKPTHASSYFRIGELLKNKNHMAAAMSYIMYLLVEADPERSKICLGGLQQIMFGSVKKTGDKSTSITLDINSLDTKKSKKEEDNLHSAELLYNLSSALDKDSVLTDTAQSAWVKFNFRLQTLIESLSTVEGKGFFISRYIPFFKALKENNYTLLVSRLVYASSNDEHNTAWLRTNSDKTDAFYNWLKNYNWPK